MPASFIPIPSSHPIRMHVTIVVRSFSNFSIAAPLQPLDKPAEQPHEPEDRRNQNNGHENLSRLVAPDELPEAILIHHFELSSHSNQSRGLMPTTAQSPLMVFSVRFGFLLL